MANDPLSQFRKSPITPNGGMVQPTEADEYLAFGTKDKVRRLKIRSSPILVHSPGYNLLLDVVYDGQHGTQFILVPKSVKLSPNCTAWKAEDIQNLIKQLSEQAS